MSLTLRKSNAAWNKWILEPVKFHVILGKLLTHLWILGVFFSEKWEEVEEMIHVKHLTCEGIHVNSPYEVGIKL